MTENAKYKAWLAQLAEGDTVRFYKTRTSKAFTQVKVKAIIDNVIRLSNGHMLQMGNGNMAAFTRSGKSISATIKPV